MRIERAIETFSKKVVYIALWITDMLHSYKYTLYS
jgi:hypothetical protein